MALPSPYNNAGLIMQGFGQLGTGLQQIAEQEKANAPGDPDLDAYFNRLLNGEDPVKLGAEARSKGILDQLMQRANTPGAMPNPGAQVPDVGTFPQGNVPAPGSINPAGGPQGPARPGLGSAAPAPAPAPAAGGQLTPGTGTLSRSMPFDGADVSTAQGPNSGLGGRDALVAMAQPMQAPTSGLGGASYRQGPPPQERTQAPAPQAAAQPQGRRRTVAEQQRLMQLAPTIEASRSRETVARIKAEQAQQSDELKISMQGAIALLRAKGMDDASIRKMLTGIEGMDTKAQIAWMQGLVSLEKAQIGANATMGAASLKAQTGQENEELKSLDRNLNSLRSQLAQLGRADKYMMPDGTMGTRDQAIMDLQRYEQRRAEITGIRPRDPVQGPTPPGTTPVSDPNTPRKGAPAPKKTEKKSVTIRVRNKKTGKTGSIPAENFNPATYEKI